MDMDGSQLLPTASPEGTFTPERMMLLVQSLRGAPASVLLALAVTGRFMSHKELQLWTRCGKDQVTFALRSLVHLGWAAARTSRGPWVLVRPLDFPPVEGASPANPLKGLSSGIDSLNLSTQGTLLLSPSTKELLEAMYASGIREPTASELSELPHVTLEYLQAHIAGARALGLSVGSAIEAMRLGAPAPSRPASHDRQAEVADKIRRFMEGR